MAVVWCKEYDQVIRSVVRRKHPRGMLSFGHDREDLEQIARERVLGALEKLDPEQDPTPWIRRIALCALLDELRYINRQCRQRPEHVGPPEHASVGRYQEDAVTGLCDILAEQRRHAGAVTNRGIEG